MGSKSFSLGEDVDKNPSISFNRDNSELSRKVSEFDYQNTDAPQETPEIVVSEAPKMDMGQAYFALIKAYCAINVLLLPKAFKNGGWLLSPLSLMVACVFEATCAIKLAQCGLFTGTISY